VPFLVIINRRHNGRPASGVDSKDDGIRTFMLTSDLVQSGEFVLINDFIPETR
jgi:hypothetical protein